MKTNPRLSIWIPVAFCLVFIGNPTIGSADEFSDAIKVIQSIGKKGGGHNAAVEAMKVLNKATASQIPQLLEAMNNSNPVAQNWLRSAIDSAVGRSDSLPTEKIQAYFDKQSNCHLGRFLAFDLLTAKNDSLKKSITEKLYDDPSPMLRRKGIKWLADQAKEKSDAQKIGLLGFAINKARDVDQVQSLQAALSKAGVEIDLTKQLGYLTDWKLVGPFDNRGQKGFDVAFGPEKNLNEIDPTASYKDGRPDDDGKPKTVTWKPYETSDDIGVTDLNQVIGKVKGAIIYAYTEFESDKDQDVEIRIGCINANKVWINGKLVISNEVYHVGMMPDQFSGTAKLKKGNNKILFKICQNEQRQPWAQRWMFQLRVCDKTGKAVQQADDQPAEE